jgi:hypothetical protein
MKLKPLEPGELRYAVAIRKDSDLWLTLWVRRSPKSDFYVMIPRNDRDWNPRTSYHRGGTRHAKSHGQKLGVSQKRQPLTPGFKGTENLGAYKGTGPASERFATRQTSPAL